MSSQNDENGTNIEMGTNQEEQRSTDEAVNEIAQEQQDPHTSDSAPEEQRLPPDDEKDDVSYRKLFHCQMQSHA